ncbi:MAG: helix-turn-helix domain-containing protein, partial [Clostridiales bacterium]|nr:helix-turn-helix domain-containing protein [Clostridiales bacterium]
MKLNSDIVFENLKKTVPSEMCGHRVVELSLGRPVFCVGNERAFHAGQLYVAKADRLPQRPVIEKGAVIICVGESLHFAYYGERCCVIRIRENENLFSVFNLIQGIFNKYDAWNEQLQEILNSNAGVEKMVECSRSIFENPIFVINADFRFIAYSGYADPSEEGREDTVMGPAGSDNLRLPALGRFLELSEPSFHVKEPQLFNLPGSSTLNVNLFKNEDYIGCLTIDYRLRAHLSGDTALARHLADMIMLATQKYPAVLYNEKGALRQALQGAVDGLPADAEQSMALAAANLGREYVCAKMQFSNRFAQLPAGYIRNMVEESFPQSVAFEYDSSVVAFIETKTLYGRDGTYRDKLQDMMKGFIQSMDMRVGVSDSMDDLNSARLFYRQACAALKNGNLVHFKRRYYTFQDYALMEMVVNSLGELSAELYYSKGMRRLAEHDASASHVSYLETLRVYLDQNMSITKTASLLYIHRSTLLERLSRIKKELDTDLENPDERLRLQILLKAIQIHEAIRVKQDGQPL